MSEPSRSEEHTSELQSPCNLVCRLLLEKKKKEGTAQELRWNKPDHVIIDEYKGQLSAAKEVVDAMGLHDFPLAGLAKERVFFFNDTATTEIYTLSLHDALPI